jgi:hypothetical protein
MCLEVMRRRWRTPSGTAAWPGPDALSSVAMEEWVERWQPSPPGGGSVGVRMIRAAVFFPGDPTGVTGSVWAADLALF